MPVGFVILAFFVGGFFGAIAMALACAVHDANEFSESMRVSRGWRRRRATRRLSERTP